MAVSVSITNSSLCEKSKWYFSTITSNSNNGENSLSMRNCFILMSDERDDFSFEDSFNSFELSETFRGVLESSFF